MIAVEGEIEEASTSGTLEKRKPEWGTEICRNQKGMGKKIRLEKRRLRR